MASRRWLRPCGSPCVIAAHDCHDDAVDDADDDADDDDDGVDVGEANVDDADVDRLVGIIIVCIMLLRYRRCISSRRRKMQ